MAASNEQAVQKHPHYLLKQISRIFFVYIRYDEGQSNTIFINYLDKPREIDRPVIHGKKSKLAVLEGCLLA